MSFDKWMKEAKKDMDKKERKDLKKSKGVVSKKYHDRLIQYWVGYKTIQSTKKLVWATWILAIITIILAISTIIFSVVSYSQTEKDLELSEKTVEASERTANATEVISESIITGEVEEMEGAGSSTFVWILIALVIIFITIIWIRKKIK